jgi:heme iron utilization protein
MLDSVQHTALVRLMADDPGAVVEHVAKEHSVSPRAVVEALPVEMRRFAPASAFVEAMDIAGWGEVTVIVHTDDGILEFTGPVPNGEIGRGYYNLAGRTGFHGHLRHERCDGLAFIERPFMGRPSASVLFFNVDGGVMFKVFVGRDEKRALKAEQLDAFRALAKRLTEQSPPDRTAPTSLHA